MEMNQRRLAVATAIIGVGLSGFFDGILLHQVLQWHHLLSLVPGRAFQDIRTQILADGLFHVLMYLVTAWGLWLLWRARHDAAAFGWPTAAGGVLLGFGVWNIIDVVFFHWILGIHRIRVGVPNPMAYDLGWLVLFALIPLGLAWASLRRGTHDPTGHGTAAAVSVALLALAAAPLAGLPQRNANNAVVLMGPSSTASTAFNLADAAGTAVVWADPRGGLMVVRLGTASQEARLYAAGALIVTRSPAIAGCTASLSLT